MPARFALFVRLVLAWASGFALVATRGTGAVPPAWSQDEDDAGDEEDDGEAKPGDDKGGDEDGSGTVEEDDDEAEPGEEAGDQPEVWAGGLFTKKTYPVAETLRPLTLTRGMVEVKAGFNMDMNAQHAFESWRIPIEARFGLRDHVELQVGADFLLISNEQDKQQYEDEGQPLLPSLDDARLSLGLEAALYYDLVDFRVALEFPINPGAPGGEARTDLMFGDGLDPPEPFDIGIVVGLPFRIAPRKQVAVFALDRIFTVHTISGSKPDLNVAVGLAIAPVDLVSVILRGEFVVPEFNTNFLLVPASAAVQFTPTNTFDIGLEFTLASLKLSRADEAQNEMNPDSNDDVTVFSRRFLLLYGQARF